MLKCTFVGELLTPLLDIGTQWMPLSADIDKRSNAEADDGTLRRRRTAPTRHRAELNLLSRECTNDSHNEPPVPCGHFRFPHIF